MRAAGSTGISNFQSNSGWEGEDEVFCPVVSMALLSLSIRVAQNPKGWDIRQQSLTQYLVMGDL